MLTKHVQCQFLLKFGWQFSVKMVLSEVISRWIFDIFFHHCETLIEKSMIQRFALSSHTYPKQVKFHLWLLFGDNFIKGLDSLILKDKIGHRWKNQYSNQRHEVQIKHFCGPDRIRIIEGLVVTVTYSCDRSRDQIKRLEVASTDTRFIEFKSFDTFFIFSMD